MPPVDKPGPKRPVLVFQSPREAAAQAWVYRRRNARERPRERLLRVAGLVGTLLVHLVFLFGAVLGSAYDWEPPERPPAEALRVRFIEQAEPPPPPPVRGRPPRRTGPTHQGRPPQPRRTVHTEAPAAPAPPAAKPEMPSAQVPVITVDVPPATIKLAPVAAPPPPVSLPKPQPEPDLAPVSPSGEPPQIVLDTPPAPRPVPPRFQPEPVRKPQAEGTRPMPTPPSLAMPELPAQSPPQVSAPSIALDSRLARPDLPVGLVQPSPPVAAAPPVEPALESVPLPAQPAPRIDLQSTMQVTSPQVPRERTQVQVPTITLDQPRLAPVPPTRPEPSQPATPQPSSAPTPRMDVTMATAPVIELPTLSPASLSPPSPSDLAPPAPVAAASVPAPAASQLATPVPLQTPAPADDAGQAAEEASLARTPDDDVSRAEHASAQGDDYARPGQVADAPTPAVASSMSHAGESTAKARPDAGRGQGKGEQGKDRTGADQGAAQGSATGKPGSYIPLKPRGDTEILSHRVPGIEYHATRFAGDWTPEGESVLDTALRHAVEKTTVEHTFRLPRGVRVKCAVMPLLPMALLGCGNGNPPPRPVAEKVYDRMHLAPSQPLAPAGPATVAAAASAADVATPVALGNQAECAAARISGGPLPPGCPADQVGPTTVPARPVRAPAASASSWVPASDQFQ